MKTKTLNNKTFIFKDYKAPKYKEIVYNGKTYQYEIVHEDYSSKTKFYCSTTYVGYRKYLLFGPIIIETTPKLIFTLWFDIEYERFSKTEVREAIQEKVDILNRKKEIKRGEII